MEKIDSSGQEISLSSIDPWHSYRCMQVCTDVYVHTRTHTAVLLERLELVLVVSQLWWGSVVLLPSKLYAHNQAAFQYN